MLHKNILRIRDENGLGEIYHELELRFDKIEISVKDIIIERVHQEVEKYNKKAADYKYSLVRPKDEEVLLNNIKNTKKRRINSEKQVEVALNAFSTNGFFILIDETQAETLERVITIKPDTMVSFIKLTPLVGG